MPRTPKLANRPKPNSGTKLKKKSSLSSSPSRPKKSNSNSKEKEKTKSKLVIATAPPRKESKRQHLLTRAGLRRAATRAGIRCMSKGCLDELMNMFDSVADECLLQARNNAYYVRKAKTISSADIAVGSMGCGLGELVSI